MSKTKVNSVAIAMFLWLELGCCHPRLLSVMKALVFSWAATVQVSLTPPLCGGAEQRALRRIAGFRERASRHLCTRVYDARRGGSLFFGRERCRDGKIGASCLFGSPSYHTPAVHGPSLRMGRLDVARRPETPSYPWP